MSVTVNASTGIVTSNNTSQLNIITQTGAHEGYHFVIRTNGAVWQIGRINRTSNGAAGQNANTIHISIMGLFWDGVSIRPRRNNGTFIAGVAQPSVAQRTAVQRLVQGLLNNTTLSGISNLTHIFGHRHLPNQSTYCPGMTRANVQSLVSGGGTPAPGPTPSPAGGTHTVRAGETLFGIAQMHGTTVAVLQQLNNMGSSTTLQIGQVLRLP